MTLLTNPIKHNYKEHIDGLRALAIIPVFLYHLNPTYCSGGFGGVDVFFVISGYLISLGIFSKLEKGSFSILEFYDRRIRRIIPIYSVTILFVLLVAPFIFYHEKLYDLAKLAISGTFFVANIDLYFSQNYFTQGQLPNPLTNLWSLSVEEQFYAFLPVLLLLSYKFAKKYIFYILILLFLFSFGLTLIHFFMDRFAGVAFYILPFRMYELLMGTFLAYFTLNTKTNESANKTNCFPVPILSLITITALFALIAVYYSFSSEDTFPGLWAFTLSVLTVILIKFGNLGVTGKILTFTPLVFIGKISYSVYLIHYPLIIFWRYISYSNLSIFDEILIILLTFGISTLTCIYVELPIRISKTWTRKKSFFLYILTSSLILFVASLYFITDAFRKYINISPYSDEINIQTKMISIKHLKPENFVKNFNGFDIYRLSNSNKEIDTLVMGDSHSLVLSPGLEEEFSKNNIASIYMGKDGSIGEYSKHLTSNSSYINSVLNYLDANANIKYIIIINRWTLTLPNKITQRHFRLDDIDGFEKFVKELNKINVKVIVTSTVPEPLIHIVEYKFEKELFLPNFEIRVSKAQYKKENLAIMQVFELLEMENLIKTIRLEPVFEDGDFYRFEDEDGQIWFCDDDHLSLHGAKIVAKHLVEEFLRIRAEKY